MMKPGEYYVSRLSRCVVADNNPVVSGRIGRGSKLDLAHYVTIAATLPNDVEIVTDPEQIKK